MPFLAYDHTVMRWALKHMTAPEFKVYTYMISIAIRPKKSEAKGFRNGKEIRDLYRKGSLLPVNVSIARIAEQCKLSDRTVAKAIHRFSEKGLVIKITRHRGRFSNVYLVGVENMWKADVFRPDYYFAAFTFIQDGDSMPDAVRYFILENRYNAKALASNEIPRVNKKLYELFAQSYNAKKHDNVVNLWPRRG